jgi:hypothetical protein
MYQPKTGNKCGCKRGIERDNCPACGGMGLQIDFKAVRERNIQCKHCEGTCSPYNRTTGCCDDCEREMRIIAYRED